MRTTFTFLFTVLSIILLTANCKEQPAKNQPVPDTGDSAFMILYIGTYTEKEAHDGGKATGVYIYGMDKATGRLSYIGTSPAVTNPSYLDVHPSGKWMYTVNETGKPDGSPGAISAFRLTDNGKVLEYMNTVSSEGDYPCFIQVDQTGKYAMTANYGSGTVALLPISADGSLGSAVSVDHHSGMGHSARQEAAHAHMITNSKDNRFAYSCDLGTDIIYIYRLDTGQGKLVPTGNNYHTEPGAGPRHLTFHPLKNLAYVINELNGTIECMQVDTVNGTLTRFQVVSTVTDGKGKEASCADIHVSPAGNFLYASNRGMYNNIAIYSVDARTGELALIGHQEVKGRTPRNFIIEPAGNYLLVANQDSDNVVTFGIDPETGKLIDIGVEVNIPAPVCLKFLK